jgi:chromosome segregation ATPase
MPIALCARIPVILKHRRMLPQDLYSAKFKQLQTKLKAYEQGEAVYQSRYGELRQECQSLQAQVTTIEASRRQLEDSLKDETSARAQLVTEIFHMRKVGVQARWSLI